MLIITIVSLGFINQLITRGPHRGCVCVCLFWVDVFSVGSKQMTLFLEIVCVFVRGCQFIQDCFFVPRVPVPEDLANQDLELYCVNNFQFYMLFSNKRSRSDDHCGHLPKW